MYCITYDQWKDLVDEAVEALAPLLDAMCAASDGLQLDKGLADELKREGQKELKVGDWTFLLALEPHDDAIGGFVISLLAEESLEDLEVAKELISQSMGFTLFDVRNFEAEHGLDLDAEILDKVEEDYGIKAEADLEVILFYLVVFDSQDTDNSCRMACKGNDGWNIWQENQGPEE